MILHVQYMYQLLAVWCTWHYIYNTGNSCLKKLKVQVQYKYQVLALWGTWNYRYQVQSTSCLCLRYLTVYTNRGMTSRIRIMAGSWAGDIYQYAKEWEWETKPLLTHTDTGVGVENMCYMLVSPQYSPESVPKTASSSALHHLPSGMVAKISKNSRFLLWWYEYSMGTWIRIRNYNSLGG